MKLHEAIKKIIEENNKPLSINELTLKLNTKGYYIREDNQLLKNTQVLARIKNYPLLFENINGVIIMTDNSSWKNIISSYLYLKEILRGIFGDFNIQFLVASLLFYKRLLDINNRAGRKYPIDFNLPKSSIDELIDGGQSWLKYLNEIENFQIAPEGVFEETAKELLKLNSFKRIEILSVIKNIDTSSFNDSEFGNIYEYLLYQNSKEYFGYENSTPETIRNLLPELLNLSDGKIVYDPVSGTGGLLTRIFNSNQSIHVKGSEINERIAQLGNMNLMMHGLDYNSTIVAENCFDEINNEQKYDYIIGDLPINGITNTFENYVLYNQFNLGAPKSGKGFSSLVLFCFYKLSDNGKAVITLSDSFLTKGGKEKEIRKVLIENDVIESVISLPRGTYRPYTESKVSILIINKNKPNYLINKIKFIKVSAIEENKKHVLLDIDQIIDEYNNELSNSKYTQIIDLDDIEDFNISADKYDVQFYLGNVMLKDEAGKYLKELVSIKLGKQPKKEELILDHSHGLPIIKIENLSKDILDINLNVKISILDKVNDYKKYYSSVVSQNCLIIAKIGENIKPTIFRPSEDIPHILLHSGVFALIPKDENELDLEYLYYQFNSSFVKEQISSKKTGTVMPFINKSNLDSIIIPYMDITAQKAFKESQKADLVSQERNKVEEKIKALGYEEEIKFAELNIVRTITHQLRHNLTGISTIIEKANKIVTQNNITEILQYGEDDPILISKKGFEPPENMSLGEILNISLKKALTLNSILLDVEKAINLNLVYSEIGLINLLNEIKKDYKNENFIIEITGDEVNAELSKTHIEDLVNTLILNAKEHSFKGTSNNKISFNITILGGGILQLEYKNNGLALTISEKDYKSILTKSRDSNGTGIGGYYINKIVEAHKGALRVIENTKKGVQILIELPLKQNENE